jgi:selenocysteine lyase/cysteine desulfurase
MRGVRDLPRLRAEFPVLERLAYLNAGTNGPVPGRALEAAVAALREQTVNGRGDPRFFKALLARVEELRDRVARVIGCGADELAITGSTTDGVNTAVSALELGPGDEVLTSDEEHPGLLAPLAAGSARRGFEVRTVPFDELPGELGFRTRLLACSHVSWVTGRVLDVEALRDAGVPVLLDGAQSLGALPVDVRALGCDFYAASGQKWLCGPNGLGYLYLRRERIAELPVPWPGHGSLAAPDRPLELELRHDGRRFDVGLPAPHEPAWALAALDTLEDPGLELVLERAASLSERLAGQLAERGLRVAPRGRSTLVSWEASDPEGTVERMWAEAVVVRNLPGRPYVRASVGGWNSEEELERLVALAA